MPLYKRYGLLVLFILFVATSIHAWSLEIQGSPYSVVWNETGTVSATIEGPEDSYSSGPYLMNTNRAILCNNSLIYTVSLYYTPVEEYGNLSFSNIIIVNISNGIPRLEKVITLNDTVVNSVTFDKNNSTIYLAGIDTSKDYKLKIDSTILGDEYNWSYYLIGFFQGISSKIIKLNCNGTFQGETRIENFTIRSIDYNNRYGLLAILGYNYNDSIEQNQSKNWKIILMNNNFEKIYESSTITTETTYIAPSGIQWSPSGKYLSTGLQNNSIPLIYEYNPMSRTLHLTYTINITSDILTNSWLILDNQTDILLIGTDNKIYIINMNTTPGNPIIELSTDKRLCCGTQALRNTSLITFVEARYNLQSETEKLAILFINISSQETTTQWISSYEVHARDFINQEIFPVQSPNNPNAIYYTRINTYSYAAKTIIAFTLLEASIIKNTLLTIHTIPRAEIQIANITSGYTLYSIIAGSSTLKTYLPPGKYSITITLPKPENYIGSGAGLTSSTIVNITAENPAELYLDYQNLLGTLHVEAPENITITLYDLQTDQAYRIEPGKEYYIAPGEYSLTTTSDSPVILANTSYNINIHRGEAKLIKIPLSQIRIIIPENYTVEISGPGGTTRIPGSGNETIVYVVPGEYTVELMKGNEIISQHVVKATNTSLNSLDLAKELQEENNTSTTVEHTELGPNKIIIIMIASIAILIGIGYLLRSRQ